VIDRLRAAAAAERGRGRAQAALVYALTLSGKYDEAETEFRKLNADHPLLQELRAFVRRHNEVPDGGAEPGDVVDPIPLTAGPASTTAKRAAAEVPAAAGDFRAQLEEASKALRSGNPGRAEQLYQAVLARHPRNTEALAGLGDVARQRGESARALQYYEQVLSRNPSYLPALVGAADVKWASGDRRGALVLYRRIHEQAGPGTSYGQRAADRIKQAEGSPAAEPADASKPSEQPQRVETTELPESPK
jgi:tetratricopeptide (TPR) repeat protein